MYLFDYMVPSETIKKLKLKLEKQTPRHVVRVDCLICELIYVLPMVNNVLRLSVRLKLYFQFV